MYLPLRLRWDTADWFQVMGTETQRNGRFGAPDCGLSVVRCIPLPGRIVFLACSWRGRRPAGRAERVSRQGCMGMRNRLVITLVLGMLLAVLAAGAVGAQSTGVSVDLPGGGIARPRPGPSRLLEPRDDDGDGAVDLGDPGCSNPLDGDETDATTPPTTTTPADDHDAADHHHAADDDDRPDHLDRATTRPAAAGRSRRPPRQQGSVRRRQGRRSRLLRQGRGRRRRLQGRLRRVRRSERDPDPGDPPPRRHADELEPDRHDRQQRRRPDRRPQLRHRAVLDPALPAPDLPGLRNPVRGAVGGPRLDQPDRDRVRHEPQRLHRRRARLDAVHARDLGDVRSRRQQRRPQGPLQPGRRDLRRRQLPEGRRRRGGPLPGDLRLQPRRLVRRRGPPLREAVRQPPERPRRLAHRPHRGRPLPGRREVALRRRHLRARRDQARGAEPGLDRQRRRRHQRLADPARHRHLLEGRRPGRRRQRRRHHEDRPEQAARPLHRPPRRLRQRVHLRRPRQDRQGDPGAEAEEPDARRTST